jgi:intracellular sulfur oxidation DsrE/DsrF family protein
LVTEVLVAKLENLASREDRPVVEVAADSTAAAVVVKEDLAGENAAEAEEAAVVPVLCHPEGRLE